LAHANNAVLYLKSIENIFRFSTVALLALMEIFDFPLFRILFFFLKKQLEIFPILFIKLGSIFPAPFPQSFLIVMFFLLST
jgi:hypothetical protein